MVKKSKKIYSVRSRTVVLAMSPYKSLRDYTGQAGGAAKERVVVAMSGGVDSSVAAALLKKQGYDVIGVFMRFWVEPSHKGASNTCCSEGAEQAARNVANKLGIPFYVLKFGNEFKKEVVDYFLREEKLGHTPNPCVACNKKIKFGLMFQKALLMGADFVATGHYALIKKVKSQKSKVKSTNQNSKILFKLYKGEDPDKDQSYFLYALTQTQLSRVLFPIGDYTKDEVYQMAKKWRLPFRREESFDLCFVASDRENFLKKYLRLKTGNISDLSGGVLGSHQGLALYTIGQRKNIPLQQGPWWVVKKDEKRNILYVSNNEKDLYRRQVVVTNINWLSGEPPAMPIKVWAKIRYKSQASLASVLEFKIKNLKLIFVKPQRAITPGQSVVFYSKNGEVLGGGVIV